MAELALVQRQQDPFVQQLNSMRVAQLMVVPTSARPALCRPLGYADASKSRPRVCADFAVGNVGIARRHLVACPFDPGWKAVWS